MMAAYSSAVPLRRLLDAIFGTSLAIWICEKWPSVVKTRRPFGVSPNGNDFLPSGPVISATTKLQVPMSWSRRLFPCCAVALPKVSASVNAAAAICMMLMMFLPRSRVAHARADSAWIKSSTANRRARSAPSPHRGEGWGEGVTIERLVPPHPRPLPDGERASRRAVIRVGIQLAQGWDRLLRLEPRRLRDPVGLLDLGLEIDAERLGGAADAFDTEISQAFPDRGVVEPLVDGGVEPLDDRPRRCDGRK